MDIFASLTAGYGCIVWNAHNTVFGLKRSAICAQAAYFLHLTRPSVTCRAAVLSTRIRHCRKFGEVSCTECTRHGNDFKLIPMERMEN